MYYLTGSSKSMVQAHLSEAASPALNSTCRRSRCGAVIADTENGVIGRGWNSPPRNCSLETCLKDALPADFKSDKTCCLHAEQRAIFDAAVRQPAELVGATLYFIRLSETGQPMAADEPYCAICSKVALDTGLATFVLVHPEGIVAYETKEYNERSFGRIPSLRTAQP